MTIKNLDTIETLEAFLQGNQPVAFSVFGNKTERYNFIRKTLVKFNYMSLSKRDKGIVIRYLLKMTGYSRQQLTRLIKKQADTGQINWMPSRLNGFAKKYTNHDIRLLAKTDERHDTPCGHAVKKLCERAHHVFNDQAYENLSTISVSHLYNLHQCSAISVTLGFKCLAKLSIMTISDLPVIIAFCRERMVNEHMRVIRAWKSNGLTKHPFPWATFCLLSRASLYFLSDG